MNRIQLFDVGRVIARHFKLDKTTDPIASISSEAIPVFSIGSFDRPHPQDTEVNRAVYDGLQAGGVLSGQPVCFELFNPPNSGVVAELLSFVGSGDQNATLTFHLAITNSPNPHAGGSGIGKFLHLGSQNVKVGGNATLTDGYDLNTTAAGNGGGGFISIRRIAANSSYDLMCPGCPVFLPPGSAARMQASTSASATINWAAAWIERRQPQYV